MTSKTISKSLNLHVFSINKFILSYSREEKGEKILTFPHFWLLRGAPMEIFLIPRLFSQWIGVEGLYVQIYTKKRSKVKIQIKR